MPTTNKFAKSDKEDVVSGRSTKARLPKLSPTDPRVTAAVVKRIKAMSLSELQAQLARRSEGIIERQFPDPSPTSRRELLDQL